MNDTKKIRITPNKNDTLHQIPYQSKIFNQHRINLQTIIMYQKTPL